MLEIPKFISAVQEKLLQFDKQDINEQEQIWNEIGKNFDLDNGYTASELWFKLVDDYIDFLRNRTDFEFSKEMRFMQSFIISEESDSDDLDEDELQRILDSDSETSYNNSVPAKKRKIVSQNLIPELVRARIKKPLDTREDITSTRNSTSVAASVSSFSSLQLIFLGYAKVLQEMPIPLQIQTKRKIAEIMEEAEMEMLKTAKSN